jgi:hypothetical protein
MRIIKNKLFSWTKFEASKQLMAVVNRSLYHDSYKLLKNKGKKYKNSARSSKVLLKD